MLLPLQEDESVVILPANKRGHGQGWKLEEMLADGSYNKLKGDFTLKIERLNQKHKATSWKRSDYNQLCSHSHHRSCMAFQGLYGGHTIAAYCLHSWPSIIHNVKRIGQNPDSIGGPFRLIYEDTNTFVKHILGPSNSLHAPPPFH